MYIVLLRLLLVHCLWTIIETTSNERIVRNLQRIVDTALQTETSDEVNNDQLVRQLTAILEDEEGFRLVDRPIRSLADNDQDIYDGSGDLPPFYSNMSIITFTMVRRRTNFLFFFPRLDFLQRSTMIVFSSNNRSE